MVVVNKLKNPQFRSSVNKIGDYIITGKIGSGSFGDVYSCYHEITGEKVAIKVIYPTVNELSVYTEISIGQLLYKDNVSNSLVVPVRDSFVHENQTCLVMELVQGIDLFDKVTQYSSGIPESELIPLFHNIVLALHYAHQHNVVHRDIKPENIIITSSGCKLIDFGMACVYISGTFLKTYVGSLEYCSPEVLRAIPYDGFKADCWSLGVLLYVLATGLFPWNGSTKERVIANSLKGKFAPIPKASPELRDLLSQLLCVDPELRYNTEDTLNHPFFSVIQSS